MKMIRYAGIAFGAALLGAPSFGGDDQNAEFYSPNDQAMAPRVGGGDTNTSGTGFQNWENRRYSEEVSGVGSSDDTTVAGGSTVGTSTSTDTSSDRSRASQQDEDF